MNVTFNRVGGSIIRGINSLIVAAFIVVPIAALITDIHYSLDIIFPFLIFLGMLILTPFFFTVFHRAFNEREARVARGFTALLSFVAILFAIWVFHGFVTVNGPGLEGIEYAFFLPFAMWGVVVGVISLVRLSKYLVSDLKQEAYEMNNSVKGEDAR